MTTTGMQMTNQVRGENPTPSRTLEFRQAMKDFRTMFPTLDSQLIECVLRSNAGHVDSTIDQLLQLSQDGNGGNNSTRRRWNTQNGRGFHSDDDSTDSDDSIPSELLDPPTSSDDDVIPIRDPPPQYTPHADDDPARNFFGASYPIGVPMDGDKQASQKDSKSGKNRKVARKPYRAWNPPFLGQLPDDFLRILPQQFMSSSKEDSEKPTAALRKRSFGATSPTRRNTERITPPPGMTGPIVDSSRTHYANNEGDDQTPPPRPPRTIPPSNRRLPQYNDRDNRHNGIRSEPFVPGDLFIRQAAENRSFSHRHSADHQRQRHHHHHRSSRSGQHGSRCSNSQQPVHHQSFSASSTNGNHTRRSSDFSSRRMVMVSRRSEPAIPLSHNGVTANDRLPTHHRSFSQRSSSNSLNHQRQNSGHQSPVFRRTELPSFSPQLRSSTRSAGSSMRSRQRTSHEEEQYVEDCRLAILLQNEEFIRELKRNDEFLKALEKDRPGTTLPTDKTIVTSVDKELVPLPDPDAKYPHGARSGMAVKREGLEEIEKDDGAFQENLKHMGKSARKKFNEIAKKFSVKKKSSYKSMKNIDPVFANCDDSYDEESGPQSPVFDL